MSKSIKVEYTGIRRLKDKITGTGGYWFTGDVRVLPMSSKAAVIRHGDIFKILTGEEFEPDLVEDDDVFVPEPEPEKDNKLDLIEETRLQLDLMDSKDAIIDFIENQWGISVDLSKSNTTLAKYREIANMHIDNLGLIGND